MKRFLALVLVIAFFLFGCGGGGGGSASTNSNNSSSNDSANSTNENDTSSENNDSTSDSSSDENNSESETDPNSSTNDTTTETVAFYPTVSNGYVSFAMKEDKSLWYYSNESQIMKEYTPAGKSVVGVWSTLNSTIIKQTDNSVLEFGLLHDDPVNDGFNSYTYHPISDQIFLSSDFIKFSFSETNYFAIKSDNTLWGYGYNSLGSIGIGHENKVYAYTQIGTQYSEVAAGDNFTIGLKNDKSLWTWGDGSYGQLGNGDVLNSSSPINIGSDFVKIAAGRDFGLAIKSDGKLYGWGGNYYGQVGINSTEEKVLNLVLIGSEFKDVFAANETSFGIKKDNSLWAWGANFMGGLGDGTSNDSLVPIKIGSDFIYIATMPKSSASNSLVLGLKSDGTLWIWGDGILVQTNLGAGYKTK